jgi:hypothetical protein
MYRCRVPVLMRPIVVSAELAHAILAQVVTSGVATDVTVGLAVDIYSASAADAERLLAAIAPWFTVIEANVLGVLGNCVTGAIGAITLALVTRE